MFISSGRTNYAMESLNFLMQYDYLLSPRQAEELLLGRFINTHGQAGPNDLYCEHLNRLVKTSITQLQANKTTTSMERVTRASGTVYPSFDKDNHVAEPSASHKKIKSFQDFKSVLSCLNKASVFTNIPNTFLKPRDPLHAMSQEDTQELVRKHISSYFEE